MDAFLSNSSRFSRNAALPLRFCHSCVNYLPLPHSRSLHYSSGLVEAPMRARSHGVVASRPEKSRRAYTYVPPLCEYFGGALVSVWMSVWILLWISVWIFLSYVSSTKKSTRISTEISTRISTEISTRISTEISTRISTEISTHIFHAN